MGKRVLFFGGAASSTNTVYALTVPPPPPTSLAGTSAGQGNQRVIDTILSDDDGSVSGYSLHLPSVASLQRGRLPVPAQRHQGIPRARLSAAGALVGRYWLVVGGFSVMHREMGDVWVRITVVLRKKLALVLATCSLLQALDTAYGTSSSLAADRKGVQEAREAARSGDNGLDFMDDEEDEGEEERWDEGEEEEEEEEGEEEDTGGGPVIGGQALMNMLAGGMVDNPQQQALVLVHLMSLVRDADISMLAS